MTFADLFQVSADPGTDRIIDEWCAKTGLPHSEAVVEIHQREDGAHAVLVRRRERGEVIASQEDHVVKSVSVAPHIRCEIGFKL